MSSKKPIYIGIAVLVLCIGISVGTYAYYQSTINGNVTGAILAWNCTANNSTTSVTLNLGSNLYPGIANGSKKITIASSIAAEYTITFTNLQHIGTGSDRPNLKIYKDSSRQTEIVNNSSITGTVAAGGTSDAYVYYSWPYGSQEEYISAAPSGTISITCKQTNS